MKEKQTKHVVAFIEMENFHMHIKVHRKMVDNKIQSSAETHSTYNTNFHLISLDAPLDRKVLQKKLEYTQIL